MKQRTDTELAQRTKILLSRIAKEPKSPAIIGIGEVLLQQGKYKDVITRLRSVADIYEDHSYAYHFLLGRTYAATGDVGRARRHLELAAALSPQSEIIPVELAKLDHDLSIDSTPPSEKPDILPSPSSNDTLPVPSKESHEHLAMPEPSASSPRVVIDHDRLNDALLPLRESLTQEGSPRSTKAYASPSSSFIEVDAPMKGFEKDAASFDPTTFEEDDLRAHPVHTIDAVSDALPSLEMSVEQDDTGFGEVSPSSIQPSAAIDIPQHLREALVGFSDDEIRAFLQASPEMAGTPPSRPAPPPAPISTSSHPPLAAELPKSSTLDLEKIVLALPNISKQWKRVYATPQSPSSISHSHPTPSLPAPTTASTNQTNPINHPPSVSLSDLGHARTPEELQAEAMRLLEMELGISLDPMEGYERPHNPEPKSNPSNDTFDPRSIDESLNAFSNRALPLKDQGSDFASTPESIKEEAMRQLEKELGIVLDPLAGFEKPIFDTTSTSAADDLETLATSLSHAKLPPVTETENPTSIDEQRKHFSDDEAIMTPSNSLAEIFVSQKAYAKAIKVYEALCDLEPENRFKYQIIITGIRAKEAMGE